MEKTKVLCLILAMVLASAGTAGIVMGLGGETATPPVPPDNAVNTVMDKPDEGTPIDRSAIENLYIAQGELQRKGSFVGTTVGTSTAAGIKQDVYNNRVVIGGNVFKEMITVGIVKNAYQLYMYGDNYLYRKCDSIKSASSIKWSDTASKYTEADFLLMFGHRSDALTGYILNDETVVSGTLEKEENGLFQYRYVLDINTAPARMLYEMKTNSNMSGYSTFIKAEIIVVMDKDWQVKTLTTDCKYKVPMFGGVDCVEDITETFSDVTSEDLPEKDFFEQFFSVDVVNPVDKEPDALSILMDLFAPYIGNGNSLNASVIATNNGQPVLNGMLSAKIDIENIQNIEVAAKLGDELYVEYQQGNVYVSYQDFKASTTVDGIMGVVNAFMPQTTAVDNLNADDILSKFTYEIVDGVCAVSLPLELGEQTIELNIYANVNDNGYEFTNAQVSLGTLTVTIELTDAFDVPERSGEYPEILGLLDLVRDGVIYGSVNAFNMDFDVMFDLSDMSLYATGDDLSVIYQDNTIYAEYGAIKAKLGVEDIDRIMTLLRLAGIIDGSASLELPQISVEQVIAMLSGITATVTDDGVAFRIDIDDLSAAIYLAATESGWNVDRVTVSFGDNVITLAASAPFEKEAPEVDEAQYADVMDLLTEFINPIMSLVSAKSYGAEFDFDVTLDAKTYNVSGAFDYDVNGNIRVDATVTNDVATLIKAKVVAVDGVVYLDVNGIKTAFKTDGLSSDFDLTQIIDAIYGVNEHIDSVIDAIFGGVRLVENIDVAKIDFANVVKQFSFADGVLSATINADFVGLKDVNVQLSTSKFNSLVVCLSDVNIGDVELTAKATVIANVSKIKAPNADDYILNLQGSVDNIEFAVSADLLNMDISANVNVLDNTVLARYVGGKVYAKVGEVAIVGSIDKLSELINEIMSNLGGDMATLDIGDLSGIDLSLQSILKSISIDADGALSLGLNIDGLAKVVIDFDDEAALVAITADVMGYTAQVKSSDERVPQLDIGDAYIPLEQLSKQIVAIYNSFKDIVNTGVAANVNTTVSVNGVAYNLFATINYNNGLYLNAIVADNNGKLVALDMYLVDNVLYLDVNGIRVASELPAAEQKDNTASIDVATIVGMLSKAKGYNDVLDSIIAVVEQLPDKLNGINYVDLLTSLTYDNDVLSAEINGELMGLSNFGVTLQGTSNVALTISNLAIGNVTIDSLALNATPACNEVTAPTSDYVTELELEAMGFTVTAKLDLYNKTVVATTTLLDHELALYYVDNTVYVTYGEVKAKLNVADIDKLMGVISTFIDGGIPSIEMPELDVKQILNSLSKVSTDDGYTFTVNVAGINVAISFDSNAKLTHAIVNANDLEVKATLIEGASYPVFDLNASYVDLADLLQQAAEIYNSFKDVANTGIAANVNTTVSVNGVAYNLFATINYNNGLYLNATVADNNGKLVALDMYLVDNVVYLDVNGIRVASELPAAEQKDNTASIDVATIVGMLSKAKGYNDVLDSIIAVVEQLPDKLNGINYVDLLGALAYGDDTLTATINGSLLGLTDFTVAVAGASNLEVTLAHLAIGNVTIDGLALNATPACNEVTAPTSDYVTELELEAMGFTVTAKLDLYNKTVTAVTTLLDHELALYYVNNTVYVTYGEVKAKLNVADIDKLMGVISTFIDGGIPTMEMPELDIKQILNSISKASTDNGYVLSVSVAGINVAISFDSNAKFTNAKVNVNDLDVKATLIEGASYPVFDLNDNYVDLVALVDTFASDIRDVMNAEGYDITLNGNCVIDGHVYDVAANVIYNNGLYVNANVTYNAVDMLRVKLWYVDNTLYAAIGDLKLAIAMPTANANVNASSKLDLTEFKGYNDYVDGVLDVIQDVIDKLMSGNVDYVSLLAGLNYSNGELGLDIDGEQLGLAQIRLTLSAGNGLTANVTNLTVDKLTANINANVKACSSAVVAPTGDFSTNLSIRIDDKNTLYANLDLLNGVYNFRLDDMYAMYSDNTIRLNKGDMYVSGNINAIMDYVQRIDDLVNEFSGATESTMAGFDMSAFSNVDVKAIVKSLTIATANGKVTLGATAFGMNMTVTLANGKLSTVSVPVALIDKTLQIESCAPQTFDKFDGEINYVELEQVFDDYFPVFENLVNTNSWKFSFDGDTLLTFNGADYMVAAGSYFEFYYKNTEGLDTFKLRAKLNVLKYHSDTDYWQPYMDLDIVYKDGNIYVTDRGRLISGAKDADRNSIKITVSVKTLIKCYDLYDELVAVVPQIGELVDNMKAAMDEAEKNAENISYATILSDVWYSDSKVFGLTLNGAALLSKLGEVALSAQTYGDGLSLNDLELHYDNISVKVCNLRVTASNLVEKDGVTDYEAVHDINAYDTNGHMDFNSLYELLSSFVITATPQEDSNGARSFYIAGTATIKLKFGFDLADINMGLAVKVDIDKNNNVYISAKITRSDDKIIGVISAYDDKGGDSYLYYDGVNEMFTVIRNSIIDWKHTVQETQYKWHCTKCDKDTGLNAEWCAGTHWEGRKLVTHGKDYLVKVPVVVDKEVTEKNYYYERDYAAENISTADFTANIMDYIFEMLNLNSKTNIPIANNTLEGLVKDNISNSNNSNDFGIEDIFTNYTYTQTVKTIVTEETNEAGETSEVSKAVVTGDYKVELNLTPIDSNLTSAVLNIYHDDDFKLNQLTGDLSLLGGRCTVGINMSLQKSTYGDATQIVQQIIYW